MADNPHDLLAPPDLFKRIDTHMSTREYLDKETIYAQGDKADALFYIRQGNVKLTARSKSGKKAIIAILHQGEFFGEGCLTKRSVRTSTATAIEASSIARVTRLEVTRIIHQQPAFAKLFISSLILRIARIQDDYVDQMFSSSEKRLARVLLLMAGFAGEREPEPVLLKVNQETLAEMVGTTRSRVSYFMNRFRKLGFIDYNGSVQVHSKLRSFFEGDQTILLDRSPQAVVAIDLTRGEFDATAC